MASISSLTGSSSSSNTAGDKIVAKAKQEAAEIIMKANNANSDYDPVVDTILTEWKRLWFIALHLYPPVEPAV